jgi:hypothetical protein
MEMDARIRRVLADTYDGEVAAAAELDNLGGHASLRIYWRVHLPDGATTPRGERRYIAMVLPEGHEPGRSEEGPGEVPTDVGNRELPFVDVGRFLDERGVRVPAIDVVDMERGVLLLEDLGDTTFEALYERAAPEDREALYRRAIDLLVDTQRRIEDTPADERTARHCVAWGRRFDGDLLRWELDHFTEWGLEARLGLEAVEPHREVLDRSYEQIVDELFEAPEALSLRDYQSRNIMIAAPDDWVIIDFQDALRGPCIYDLVALLRDSYIELEDAQVDALFEHYVERGREAGLTWCEDAEALRRIFRLQTVQRKLKDAGRFIFIDRVKGNPDFLTYFEPSLGYVLSALEGLEGFSELRDIVSDTLADAQEA